MAEELNHGMMMKALDYCYIKAVNGLPGFDSAEELALDYMNSSSSLQHNAKRLVNWQCAKAGTSGFITGLGGLLTLPVSIPANITSVLFLQVRMIAAVAVMGKCDIRNDQVKTLVYMCLCGSAAGDILKDVGIQLGKKLTVTAIKKISGATLTKINQKVGFRLLTKFGEKGLVNLGKTVPILGGLIGGAFDTGTTKIIGKVAIKTFLPE